MNNPNELLRVENLRTYFFTDDGVVKAVDGVSLKVNRGETLGVVGESGCGKSVTSMTIMRLIASPGRIVEGEVRLRGLDVTKLSEEEMRHIRGNRMSMIFQQPTSCLNPVFRVGDQISESLMIHRGYNKQQGRQRAIELLTLVGIPSAKTRVDSYPHEMSGGMCQRVMIAMGLACEPELLIADEPTTALDVTIQAQILELMKDLKSRYNTGIILITHDLGVIAEMADNVVVMYAGKIVEESPVNDLFAEPKHPYTQGLLASIPVLGEVKEKLAVIPGSVPSLRNLPAGCRFAGRCPFVMEICRTEEPGLIRISDTRTARCWLYADDAVEKGMTDKPPTRETAGVGGPSGASPKI
ncbi:MAG: ABC transporter ATP-binding protein [Chloroflexota bacterium]|nr:ABC transporter ATP-binding protein [Chloroflexota bacterium]